MNERISGRSIAAAVCILWSAIRSHSGFRNDDDRDDDEWAATVARAWRLHNAQM